MKLFIALTLSFASVVASATVPINHRATNFYEAMSMFYEQKFRAGEELKVWKEKILQRQNALKLDEKGGCYNKSEGDVIMVLQVEQDGVVSEVYASKENGKSRCFIGSYLGVKFPPPPIAPAYELMRML